MAFLVIGLLIWSAAHFFKRAAPAIRTPMGEKGKGLVALMIVLSIVFMVIGYRTATDVYLWDRTAWSTPVNNTLMILALYFVSPGPKKGAIFYRLRHPMLVGFIIWVVAHLLVNGDLASLVLFGGLGVWAVLEIIVINRTDGPWTPNPKGRIAKDIGAFVVSILLVGVIGSIHTLFGLSPFGV